MVKDGANRGGRRVRAGVKPGPLGEKLAAGRPATRLEDPLNEPFDFAGNDIGDGAGRAGETMPEPSDYLCARTARSSISITSTAPMRRSTRKARCWRVNSSMT